MGHYRSEMISDEQAEREDRQRREKHEMNRQGAMALKQIFGEQAAAVAFLINYMNTRYRASPEEYAAAIERLTCPENNGPV